MKKITLTLILAAFTLSSCKKDEVEPVNLPTIEIEDDTDDEVNSCEPIEYENIYADFEGGTYESGSYLAAYPGSWWVFSNEETLNCMWSEYEILNITDKDGVLGERYIDRTTVTVPKIVGRYTPNSGVNKTFVMGDSIIVQEADEEFQTGIYKQIDLDIGETWREAGGYSGHNPWDYGDMLTYEPTRTTVEYFESIELPNGTIFNDVIKIEQRHHTESEFEGTIPSAIIHLYYAKDIGLIWQKNATGGSGRYLVDYYIAPH